MKYVTPEAIARAYCFNLIYVLKLISEMRASEKWRDSIVNYNHRVIVNIADFKEFWREKVMKVRYKNDRQ